MRKVIKSLGLSLLILSGVFCLFSCNDEIIPPTAEVTPSVKGTISLPASSGLFPEDIWVKVVENETTKYVGRVNSDATFSVSGLDAAKKYDVMFTSIEPEQQNVSREFKSRAASTTNGFGGWLSDVSASIDDANIGSVKIKPLGTINGKAIRSGAVDNYDVMVYIPGTSFMAMSNEDGSFSIANVPQGTHRLRYTSDDYMSQMKEKVLLFSDDDTVNPVTTVSDVILIKNAGILKGYATLDGAASNAGIIIKLEGDNATGSEIGTTASDGSFSIPDVKPGTYSALFSYAGYIDEKVENLVIEAAKTTTMPSSVSLIANGGTITGTVRQNDSLAGTGASVLAEVTIGEADFTYSSTVDADGKFTLNDCRPADGYSITVSKTGFASVVRSGISLTVEGIILPEVMLSSEFGGLSGYVQDSEMNAINGAQINIGDYTAFTNSEGYFIKSDLPLGQYTVTLSKDGYTTKTLAQKVSIESNKTATIGTQMLNSMYGGLSGIVQTNAGTSLAGAIVLIKGTSEYTATTDENGSFAKDGIGIGSYEVTISKDGYGTLKLATTVSVESSKITSIGTQKLTPTTAVISGTAAYADKTDSTGIVITLMNSSEQPVDSFTTISDGQYTFSNVLPGAYKVKAGATGYSAVEKSITVAAGQSYTVVLDSLVSIYGKITGTVKLQGVTAYSAIQVTATGAEVYHAQTTDSGAYTIATVIPGTYTLKYEKAGFLTEQNKSATVTAGAVTTVDETTLPSSVGSLKVTASYADKAIDDKITITLYKGETSVTSTTTSVDSGAVTFSNLVIGNDYRVVATANGYSSAEQSGIIVASNTETRVQLDDLSNRFGSVAGKVTDSLGNGMSGALVLLKNAADAAKTYTITTDTNGAYAQSAVEVGNYTVTITLQGYGDVVLNQPISVSSGGTTNVGSVKVVSIYGSLGGSVSLNDGKAVEGALISAVSGANSYPATVGSDGTYSIAGMLPGSYQVTASKEGYESLSMTVSVVADRQTEAGILTLASKVGSIKVQVGYADKDVDDRMTVSISNGGTAVRTATTANSPVLAFTGIPVGSGYRVTASADGYSSSEAADVVVESNTETSVVLNALGSRFGSMSGTVQDTRGNGISGVQVLMKAVPDNGSSYTATTDTDGSFSKTGIAIGNYEITISKDGYSDLRLAQSVSVESGRTAAIGTQWLTSIYGAIGGTARLQGSADHTGILVTATGARSYTASTGADGSYSLAGMEPGSYAFAFTKAGYVNQTANVTVEADKASLVPEAILISSSCAIAGSVVLEGSPSNSGVTVSATLVGDSSKVYTATTLEDGTYYIGGLDAGQYSIQIQMNGYVTDRSKLVHTTYGNTTVIDPVVLKSVRATVRGSVTLIGTNVHTGINVMLKTQDNRLQYDATTAQDGAFVLTGVQPGVYNLYVSKAGYESKAINDITIEPSSVKTIDSISLAVAERSIYGNVQLELRSDHAGALITATKTSDPDKVYSAISNSAGDYSLAGMEPGEYRIVITSAGYRTLTLPTTDVMASSTANLGTADLIVARGTISGLIKLEGWTDYSGIIVELVGTSEETTTTSSGYYSFHVPAGNYAGGVRFSKIDFETTSDTETITVLTDSTYAVPERTIKATHNTIRGTVDVDGTNDDSGVVVSIDGTSFSMVTLTDGKYRFDHVPLGDYSLRYQRENAPVVTADISVFPALEVIVPTTTLLPQQASIHGYVTLDGMTNYTGITVEVKNNDTLQVVTASSGADGYFYIPNILTSGAYTVSYSKQGWDTQSMNVTGLTPLENRSLTLGGPVVLLDTTPPQIGSFSINTGSNFTDNKNVSLNIPVIEQGSGTVSMQLRLNGNPASPNWLPYAIVVTKDLEEIFAPNYVGNGEYTISVRVKDLAGNVSGWMDDSITLTDQKTVVKGVLTDSQLHWTEEKSPYRVEGNILVEENKTLVIDPGVEVLFAGEYYILVDGNTWVNGTEQKMVRFLNDFDYSGMWEGLIISAKSPSLVFSDEELISGNYFNYAYFAQAQRALNAGAVNQQNGLYVENCNFSETNLNSITFDGFTGSHIVLKNNILKSDMRLSIHDDSTRILIENNEIQTNFVNLFITLYSYSSIENIIIENNSFDATQIEFSVGGWDARSVNRFRFVHNIIKDTQNPIIISTVNGFYPNSSTMNFSSNNFINCSGYLVNTAGRSYQSRSDNVLPFDFTNTFWGDAATEELLSPGFDGNASFIYDFYDDFTIPRVNNGEYRVNQ